MGDKDLEAVVKMVAAAGDPEALPRVQRAAAQAWAADAREQLRR